MGLCNSRRVCSICGGDFKMDRGCNLEKRCHACRFLKLSTIIRTFTLRPNVFNCFNKVGEHSKFLLNNEHILLEYKYDVLHTTERPTPEEHAIKTDLLLLFMNTIKTILTEKELSVIAMSYGVFNKNKYTTNEISKQLKISHKQISILKDRAFNKIKRFSTLERFKRINNCDITLEELLFDLQI